MTDKPSRPRPPMTFGQQAELLEYLHGRLMPRDGSNLAGMAASDDLGVKYDIVISVSLDRAQIDDLWLTAQRLKRMAPHENEIKQIVVGR